MKVLHISHWRENTGYGEACRNYIRALDTVVDVVPRCVYLNSSNYKDEYIENLETKSSKGCDVCIQHVLPHYMDYSPMKNVGMAIIESRNLQYSGWTRKLNMMDEVWAPNWADIDALTWDGISEEKIGLVPLCFDLTKYDKNYGQVNLPNCEDTFKFYYIGEYSLRKNVLGVAKAFHLAFNSEPVSLILKLNKPGYSATDLYAHVDADIKKIKEGLKLYPSVEDYKKEVVIIERWSDEDIMRLHQTGHCYCSATRGEAWEQSAFSAMAMNNIVIISRVGGPADYLHDPTFLVTGQQQPIFGMIEGFHDLYTGRETWYNINLDNLVKKMQLAYRLGQYNTARGRQQAEKYSWINVGKEMKRLLYG